MPNSLMTGSQTHMKTYNFPYIAFALGLMLLPVVMIGSTEGSDGTSKLPLLTLLIVCEFAFLVNAIGVYIGIKQTLSFGVKPVYVLITVLCALFSARYMYLGVTLWPL